MKSGIEPGDRAHSCRERSGGPLRSAVTRARDLTELRLLVELPALRELADRGLRDEELAVARKLADATLRPARCGDLLGYRQADMAFHLYLLELTGDLARSRVARLLLAPGLGQAPVEESGQLMAAGAREHCDLVSMLADNMASAADDLLRHHISRLWAVSQRPRAARRAGMRSLPRGVTWPIA
jgi:DNA-binding GntR family transcriptional regulator